MRSATRDLATLAVFLFAALSFLTFCTTKGPWDATGGPPELLFGGKKKIDPDPAGPMVFHPEQPFLFDFGRGSGWHGLDTVAIAQDGRVTLSRVRKDAYRETASLRLTADQVREVGRLIAQHGIPQMGKAYHAVGVNDGNQWVLLLRQGGRKKDVYFNNYFPAAIRQFARDLDAVLARAGASSESLTWTRAGGKTATEQRLWDRGE